MYKINLLKLETDDISYTESVIIKNGKKRKIFIPSDKLKEAQQNILLQFKQYFFSFDSNIDLNKNEFKYVYSYLKNKNISNMANNHTGKKYVIRMDIKSFFNSITSEMISIYMQLFFIDNDIEVDDFNKFLNLITYNNYLPIGAPTSPFISNVIGYYLLDKKIVGFINNKRITYSRYADDLIFSFDNPNLKYELDSIVKIINESGFEENKKKRKIYSNGKRQIVTGICVNGKKTSDLIFIKYEATIPIEKRAEIRFYLHLINKFGITRALEFYNNKIYSYGKKSVSRKTPKLIAEETFLRIIKGKISYFNMVNKGQSEKLMNDFKLLTSF